MSLVVVHILDIPQFRGQVRFLVVRGSTSMVVDPNHTQARQHQHRHPPFRHLPPLRRHWEGLIDFQTAMVVGKGLLKLSV
jgi:hypothetical protein